MAPTLPLNGKVTEKDVRAAKTALETARATADAATAEVKEATDSSVTKQSLKDFAALGLVIAVTSRVENPEAVREAQKAYDDANKAVTLATNKLSAAKMTETNADKEYHEALVGYSTAWCAWYAQSAIGDSAGDIQTLVTGQADGVKTHINSSNSEFHKTSRDFLGNQLKDLNDSVIRVNGAGSLPPNPVFV
jgi:hypothetical protein